MNRRVSHKIIANVDVKKELWNFEWILIRKNISTIYAATFPLSFSVLGRFIHIEHCIVSLTSLSVLVVFFYFHILCFAFFPQKKVSPAKWKVDFFTQITVEVRAIQGGFTRGQTGLWMNWVLIGALVRTLVHREISATRRISSSCTFICQIMAFAWWVKVDSSWNCVKFKVWLMCDRFASMKRPMFDRLSTVSWDRCQARAVPSQIRSFMRFDCDTW